MANSATSPSTRSPRETICLRIVLGLYAAALIACSVVWRDTCIFLYFIAMEWLQTLQVLLEFRTLSAWDADDFIRMSCFGLVVMSAFLALQFVLHAIGWGARLSGRWIWRGTAAHAVLALIWMSLLLVLLSEEWNSEDWFFWILPVFVIAATKFTCALLVLREKHPPRADFP